MPKPRMRFRPGDMDAAVPVIATLVERYEAWYRTRHPEVEVVDVSDLDLMLDWKVSYGDGRLDEWSVDQLEDFLLAWCPRKVTVNAAQAALMPAAVADASTFLADQGLMSPSSAPGARLAEHARGLAPRFRAEMGNPSNFGMAKSIFGGVEVDLDQPLTKARLDALVEEFNALPFEERMALTDGSFDAEEELPVIGPVRLPDDGAVRASAEAAAVLAGFTSLAEYFRAPGRPLTAKGNIRLADAEALSEVLGTEAREQVIGDHTFRRGSSAEMPALDHWQWWAREVGAIRVRNGRMVGVEAWLKRRAKDPVGEARKAFEVLVAYGPLGSYATHGRWPVNLLVDQMVGPLLGMMLSAGRPIEFSELVDAVEAARDMTGDRGVLRDDPDYRRQETAHSVELLLTLLERVGMVAQHDITHEPTRFSQRRTGGTAELTPFGVATAVDHVHESGVEVVTIGDPASMTTRDLADLARAQEISPAAWADLLGEWVGLRPNPQEALREVVEELVEEEDALLLGMTLPVPDALEEDFAAVMQQITTTHPADDVLSAVAITWLIDHDRLDVETLPRETFLVSGLTMLGLLAKDDPEAVPAAMGTDQPQQATLELVMEASRLMPPNAEALLDSIGRHHPDKVVAKTARRELIRVRSRLIARGRQNAR